MGVNVSSNNKKNGSGHILNLLLILLETQWPHSRTSRNDHSTSGHLELRIVSRWGRSVDKVCRVGVVNYLSPKPKLWPVSSS